MTRADIRQEIDAAISFHESCHHLMLDKPQTETVEVVRWQCLDCGYIEGAGRVQSPNSCCRNSERVELRGSYERPVRPKVKRREQCYTSGRSGEIVTVDLDRSWTETSKIFHEWEE